jgi:hypothetical protein
MTGADWAGAGDGTCEKAEAVINNKPDINKYNFFILLKLILKYEGRLSGMQTCRNIPMQLIL